MNYEVKCGMEDVLEGMRVRRMDGGCRTTPLEDKQARSQPIYTRGIAG